MVLYILPFLYWNKKIDCTKINICCRVWSNLPNFTAWSRKFYIISWSDVFSSQWYERTLAWKYIFRETFVLIAAFKKFNLKYWKLSSSIPETNNYSLLSDERILFLSKPLSALLLLNILLLNSLSLSSSVRIKYINFLNYNI